MISLFRRVLEAAFFTVVISLIPFAAQAEKTWHHALSLVGTPKYAADFKHFEWVNPDAPKGGDVRMAAFGTFDSLNAFTVKGNAANGLGLIYDSLMATSPDEASTEYGLVASEVSHPDDFSSVTFRLRPEAKFHDGEPITPEDVIFSLGELKRVDPGSAFYYKNVVRAEATGPREVTFYFDTKGNRELPHIMGQLTVLPKHFWMAKDSNGKSRDLAKSSLEVPVGSGPYRIKQVKPGRSLTFERDPNYWAKSLPVSIGHWNFGTITYEYFRDARAMFEAFKAGDLDFRVENSSKGWATDYDFPAVKKGMVVREKYPVKQVAGMQAFAFNLRRSKFADPRVRRAFNLAFDFEWANKNLFYDQYTRNDSYFANSELAARGLPEGRELEILEAVRGQVPAEVFTTKYLNPVNKKSGDYRKNQFAAVQLLKKAGFVVKNKVWTHTETGEQLIVEFLLQQPTFERIVLPYADSLKRLGIKASVRTVDSSQYKRRTDTFDFDIIVASFPQSESPGNEQRDFWGSVAAGKDGSRNVVGMKNPAIDKLIDRIIFAKDRDELVAATRALDRVLLWNHYVVPQWYIPYQRLAYWKKFKHPEKPASRSIAFFQSWWIDAEQAAKLAEAGK